MKIKHFNSQLSANIRRNKFLIACKSK